MWWQDGQEGAVRSATLTSSTSSPAQSAPAWSPPRSLSAGEATSTAPTAPPPPQPASSASRPGSRLPMSLSTELSPSLLSLANMGKMEPTFYQTTRLQTNNRESSILIFHDDIESQPHISCQLFAASNIFI